MVITMTFSSREEIQRLRELALSVSEAVTIRSLDGDRHRLSMASGAAGALVIGPSAAQKWHVNSAPHCGAEFLYPD